MIQQSSLFIAFQCTFNSGCDEPLGMADHSIPDSSIKANYEASLIYSLYTYILFCDKSGK